MKTNVKCIAIALLTITLFGSCKKEPIMPLQTDNDLQYDQPMTPGSFLIDGTWVVTVYDDGSQTKPAPISNLSGFKLKFNAAHVVIGTNKETSFIGKWYYFIENKANKWLVIDFGAQPLLMISSKWQSLGESVTAIKVTGFKDGKLVNMALEKVSDDIVFKYD
jgi:hypothetical protein